VKVYIQLHFNGTVAEYEELIHTIDNYIATYNEPWDDGDDDQDADGGGDDDIDSEDSDDEGDYSDDDGGSCEHGEDQDPEGSERGGETPKELVVESQTIFDTSPHWDKPEACEPSEVIEEQEEILNNTRT
jgi:hypothetical protein